jgi:uncharacterized protein
MKSKVFFADLQNHKSTSLLNKIKKLLYQCEIQNKYQKKDIVAVKVHFGELGNTSFIRPVYLHPMLKELKRMETRPFLTDTNTLYTGMRSNSVDHLENAFLNGFNYSTLQVPVIIADGLHGANIIEIKVKYELSKKLILARDILEADGLLVVSHYKGHEISGFGATIKNISMGCAARSGKLDMHSANKPVVKQGLCTACRKCLKSCQVNAILFKEKAAITAKCTGCLKCVSACPEGAIHILWNQTSENVQKKMVEYADGVKNAFPDKSIFINVLTDISPACDCYPGNDTPVCPNIGFLASDDPLALDKASHDLVIQQTGQDPFKQVYPEIDSSIQFKYGEKIGLGKTGYELIKVD